MSVLHILIGTFYLAIFFLGICGNGLVVIVLLRTDLNNWRVSYYYLLNLALADLLFVSFLPFWGHSQFKQNKWEFGEAMCRFCGALTYFNMYASIFFLTALSLDRWGAVVKATKCLRCRDNSFVRLVCAGIWVMSFILCLPSFIYRTLKNWEDYFASNNSTKTTNSTANDYLPTVTSSSSEHNSFAPQFCLFYLSHNNPNKLKIMAALELFRSFVGFVLPLVIICCCYVSIIITIKKKVIGAEAKKDRVVKLAAVIIAAFFICWVPFHVLNIYSAFGGWLKLFEVNSAAYNTLKPIFICLAYFNSCINPLVYAFTSGTFQDNLKKCCFGTQQEVIGLDAKRQMTKVRKPFKTQTTGFNTPKNSSSASNDFGSSPLSRHSQLKKVFY